MCVCVGGGVVNDGLLALHTQLSFSTSGQGHVLVLKRAASQVAS